MLVLSQDTDVARMLDRPVWSALTTRHRRFALVAGGARGLPEDIGPFAALEENDDADMDGLDKLAANRIAGITLMQAGNPRYPDSLSCVFSSHARQMVAEHRLSPSRSGGAVRLKTSDVPEMMELARLTKPGPFCLGTHRLGAFFGVRRQGRLVAMAGERLKQPGYTEISGVCVDPAYRGQGHAAHLVSTVAAAIQARGEVPYLHVLADNEPAIRLYRRLGFHERREMLVLRLERDSTADP